MAGSPAYTFLRPPVFPIVRVLSSNLLPGFIGPKSSVLFRLRRTTFCALPRFGFAYSVRFYDTFGNYRYQHRKASLGKTHYLPICRPTSLRFGSPDIRPRSHTPARPPPRCYLVGSLFAMYMGSASCFLQTPHFWKLPLPCWRCSSVR